MRTKTLNPVIVGVVAILTMGAMGCGGVEGEEPGDMDWVDNVEAPGGELQMVEYELPDPVVPRQKGMLPEPAFNIDKSEIALVKQKKRPDPNSPPAPSGRDLLDPQVDPESSLNSESDEPMLLE